MRMLREHGWSLLLAVVVPALALMMSSHGVAPHGPFADSPDFGVGSDWDKRLHLAVVGWAYSLNGAAPWWDPFLNFGTPLVGEPESFLLHPAYWLGARFGGPLFGLTTVHAWSVSLLLLGSGWLARELKVHSGYGIAAAVAVLLAPEWTLRLGSGHIMVLGLSAWPAAVAAILRAWNQRQSGETSFFWAILSGAILGQAVLQGAHYPVPFGIALLLGIIWMSAARSWAAWVLPLAFVPGLFVDNVHINVRYALDIVVLLVLAAGIASKDRLRTVTVAVSGVAVGLLAAAGTVGAAGLVRARQIGRGSILDIQWEDRNIFVSPPNLEGVDLQYLFSGSAPSLGSTLVFPGPWAWWLLLLGLVVLIRVQHARPLGLAVAGFLVLGWTASSQLRPWEVLWLLPGMVSAIEQTRLQWIALVIAPFGLCLAAGLALQSAGDKLPALVRSGVPIVLALAALAALHSTYARGWGFPEPAVVRTSESMGSVEQVEWEPLLFSLAASQQQTIGMAYAPGATEEIVYPEEVGDLVAWYVEGGEVVLDAHPTTDVVLDRWTVRGEPGRLVEIAQRDISGWRCSGGDIVVDEGRFQSPAPNAPPEWRRERDAGHWFLTVRLGPTGTAECRWRPSGLAAGLTAQLSSALVLGILLWRRRDKLGAP